MTYIDFSADEKDPVPACRHCEFADILKDDDLFVFCHLCGHELHGDGLCDNYIYDLLKRGIQRAPLPAVSPFSFELEPIDF